MTKVTYCQYAAVMSNSNRQLELATCDGRIIIADGRSIWYSEFGSFIVTVVNITVPLDETNSISIHEWMLKGGRNAL